MRAIKSGVTSIFAIVLLTSSTVGVGTQGEERDVVGVSGLIEMPEAGFAMTQIDFTTPAWRQDGQVGPVNMDRSLWGRGGTSDTVLRRGAARR